MLLSLSWFKLVILQDQVHSQTEPNGNFEEVNFSVYGDAGEGEESPQRSSEDS